jgi:hypothetical protein
MNEQIFNRLALMPGMIFGRYAVGSTVSQAIVLRTAGVKALVQGTAWSHDAILIQHNYRWFLGDAEMGHKARLTPLEDWEASMRAGNHKAIVLWPTGAEPSDGQAAAWYWQMRCYGAQYDSLAIWHLAWRYLAEAFGNKLGDDDKFYCTESCAAAWFSGTTFRPDPWSPKLNPTPGTTRKRALQGRLRVVAGAFTEYGRQFAIPLDA